MTLELHSKNENDSGKTKLTLIVSLVAVVLAIFGGIALLQLVGSWTEDPAIHAERTRVELERLHRSADLEAQTAIYWAIAPLALLGMLGCVPVAFLGLLAYREHMKNHPKLVKPNEHGLYPVDRALLDNPQFVGWFLERYFEVEKTAAAQKKVPSHYAPQKTTHTVYNPRLLPGTQVPALPANIPELPLPGVTPLSQVLLAPPSMERVLLGLGRGGQPVYVAVRELLHIALAGPTGKGKTNAVRMLMAQLAAVGEIDLYIADPHYADSDPDNGDDWRPIRARLTAAPMRHMRHIAPFIHQLATEELSRRIEQRSAGEHWGKHLFLYVDELPSIIASAPGVGDDVVRLVREGRKFGIHLILTSQDFLVKTINVSSGGRKNLGTTFYFGGDPATGRALLGSTGNVDETELKERGIAWLRTEATPQAQVVRVPLATNESLYALLGRPQIGSSVLPVLPSPAEEPQNGRGGRTEEPHLTLEEPGRTSEELSERDKRVLDLIKSGMNKGTIIREVYGVTGGRNYNQYGQRIDELREIFLKEQRSKGDD